MWLFTPIWKRKELFGKKFKRAKAKIALLSPDEIIKAALYEEER